MKSNKEVIHTRVWEEEAELDDPFAAAACYCRGYDVYGDLLGKASWSEYLYLLFRGERPSKAHVKLMEGLGVVLANPGPRDHSVRAAMNGGAGGSTHAACLMAALAVGAGQLGGAHEVAMAMTAWKDCKQDISAWQAWLRDFPNNESVDVWEPMEHPVGFDPNVARCANPVRQSLAYLANCSSGPVLPWLEMYRADLEELAGHPLALSGVAAAAMVDLGFEVGHGEMLYLLMRLPGAAVHALEQEKYGWRKYPFFGDALELHEEADTIDVTK